MTARMFPLVCCMSLLLASAGFAAGPGTGAPARTMPFARHVRADKYALAAGGTQISRRAKGRRRVRRRSRLPGPALEQALKLVRKAAGSAGILAVRLPSGKVICRYRSRHALVPASLVKLLTSYAALKLLGPSFRFKTRVLSAAPPVDGIVSGDVWIKGSGDPFFTDDSALELAGAVRQSGVRQIRGDVFVDESFFKPLAQRICLDGDCTASYNPLVSAAAIDFNRLLVSAPAGGRGKLPLSGPVQASEGRRGDLPLSAAGPARLFARAMRAALERSGVSVLGASAREEKVPPGADQLASYASPPLWELISSMNKYSNNFMAEMLLRALGGYVTGAPGDAEKGIAVVMTALREAGIPDETATLNCGSGLSRLCRISPQTFCRLLQAVWNDKAMKEKFLSSLAVNGGKGTLKRRMRKPWLKVRGKTGTLDDVVGFAGYVSGPSGKTCAAAIILNKVRNRTRARRAVDRLVEQLALSAS